MNTSSSSSKFTAPLHLPLSAEDLSEINAYLSPLPPNEIIQWAINHLPNLHQTTAFGLTGLVGLDMVSKLTSSPPPLIFLDTLYHFNETLELVERVKQQYEIDVAAYKPAGCETAADFERIYGERLWETNGPYYDYLVKVEPAQRAYNELKVQSVITGRRASQGAARSALQPLEVDQTGLLKLNPFFAWSFSTVKEYVDGHNVPRNALLDRGYKSVGDWHSTEPSGAGDAGEREGRWKGSVKTECGLHEDYFKLRLEAKKREREEALRLKDELRGDNSNPIALRA